jgi:hypothetical protein
MATDIDTNKGIHQELLYAKSLRPLKHPGANLNTFWCAGPVLYF